MIRTESATPIWGKIAIAALILMVVCGYLFEILINPFGGLDFSIYRMGAMTIFDNEGFTKDLYAPAFVEIGVLKLPFTYPPFAALVFLPFAFLPLEWAKPLWCWELLLPRGGFRRLFTTTPRLPVVRCPCRAALAVPELSLL
nr:glycosyltransferase 87 family protein [uncultured Rothia sp.]